MALVLKTNVGESSPRVRISPSPPKNVCCIIILMKHKTTLTILTVCIFLFSLFVTITSISSNNSNGIYHYRSLHNQTVTLYGKGVYQNMTKGDALQALGQDYVTLFVGIPLLLFSLYLTRKGLLKGKLIFAGTLGYILVVYFYNLASISYNELFLAYLLLTSLSFYAFALVMLSFDLEKLPACFDTKLKTKFIGGFLILGAIGTGFGWLPMIIAPLIKGAIPPILEHYTTLVISGFDLSIFLPLSFLSGFLLIKKTPAGYLLGTMYTIFLAILMTSITAKLLTEQFAGIDVRMQQMITFPLINLVAIICTVLILKSVNEAKYKKSA